MTPTQTNSNYAATTKGASGINLLVGIWFFISPWVFGAWHVGNAWNSWIVGALIAIFAAIRLGSVEGSPFFSWLNILLGIWAFVSPWVYGYTANEGRFVNSLCVGVVVFILAMISMRATPRMPVERPL